MRRGQDGEQRQHGMPEGEFNRDWLAEVDRVQVTQDLLDERGVVAPSAAVQ